MLTVKKFVVNPIEESTFVIYDETREAAIVDCGVLYPEEEVALADFIKSEGLSVKYHLLTHSHFDHIFGADFVYRTWGLSPCMHKNELTTYEAAADQMRSFVGNAFTLVTPPAGKLFDDYHASRVLPGFAPDSKIRMLTELKDQAEIIIAVNSADIEKNTQFGSNNIVTKGDFSLISSNFGLFFGK